ncbi:MAG TPA: SWIM zinc finger family protein [Mogibacterium sp.]|nr:SWIM zinc finger family protein [Mogibacterium sp.]
MGLIELASNNSVWRGLEYYNEKKVISWERTGEKSYSGIVSGSDNNEYKVYIDIEHPRKSKCNCPFAFERRVVCKHMLALYFTVEPKAASDFLKEVEEWEAEEKERELQYYEDLKKYIKTLSKERLQEELFEAILQLEEERDYW